MKDSLSKLAQDQLIFKRGQFTKIINCITLDNPASTVFTSEEIVPKKKKPDDNARCGLPRGFCNFGEHILKHAAFQRLIFFRHKGHAVLFFHFPHNTALCDY